MACELRKKWHDEEPSFIEITNQKALKDSLFVPSRLFIVINVVPKA